MLHRASASISRGLLKSSELTRPVPHRCCIERALQQTEIELSRATQEPRYGNLGSSLTRWLRFAVVANVPDCWCGAA
jgi:hypothetical protein